MATHAYTTYAGRINEVKGEIIAHAIPVEVLALGCEMKKMPRKSGDNITYRRYIPYGATTTDVNTQNRPSVTASAHIVQEGVTPTSETLIPVDVNVKQQQYACLYSYTDKAAELYEDDIPEEQIIQTAERMGLVREMVRYGAMKACTNISYAGGSSRATVDQAISLEVLRLAVRNLQKNHAKKKSMMLASSEKYDTYAVEASYICFVHTDAASDIRNLPGFVPCAKYGQKNPLHEQEIGTWEDIRFILSPELSAYADSGAAVGSTGLYSTTGTSIDVYPFLICGKEAVFDVALRGSNSFEPFHIPHTQRDKSDPNAQRGYVGADFWAAVSVVNGGWMRVIEAGVSALT